MQEVPREDNSNLNYYILGTLYDHKAAFNASSGIMYTYNVLLYAFNTSDIPYLHAWPCTHNYCPAVVNINNIQLYIGVANIIYIYYSILLYIIQLMEYHLIHTIIISPIHTVHECTRPRYYINFIYDIYNIMSYKS